MANVEGVNLGEPVKTDYGLEGGESGLQMGVPAKGGSVTFDSLLMPKAILSCEPGTEQSLAPTVQISKSASGLRGKMERSGRSRNLDQNCFARRMALLGTFSEMTINLALAPCDAGCLIAVAKGWVNSFSYSLAQLVETPGNVRRFG